MNRRILSLIGVPTDIGAGHRSASMGPEALRVAQLAENRLKPKAKSKWSQRIEQMQETQKKLQEMQQKKGK